jgi:hypothetical protein
MVQSLFWAPMGREVNEQFGHLQGVYRQNDLGKIFGLYIPDAFFIGFFAPECASGVTEIPAGTQFIGHI